MGKCMKVKIRKATEQSYWYADQIGEEFDVIEIDNDRELGIWTVNDGEFFRCIRKRDCEPTRLEKDFTRQPEC